LSRKSNSIAFLSLIAFSFFTSLSFVIATETPLTSNSSPIQGVIVDGFINENEWADADWIVPINLDIDDVGNPPDKDGLNYLYLGEDLTNLYVGLDLCSDQTSNTSGEWVGVWLSTINASFSNSIEWATLLDDGTEAMVYDVENDEEWKFLSNTISGFVVDVSNESQYTATYGTISGGIAELANPLDNEYFNITAEFNDGSYISWVEFTINLKELYPIFQEIFPYNIQWLRVQVVGEVNDTISEHEVIIGYNDGTFNPDDPNQVRTLSTSTTPDNVQFICQKGNITDDREIKFALFANNSNPFKTMIDNIHITPYSNHSNSVATVSYPYTSIENYEIIWGFGPSPNNASDHRMYEIRISKSEVAHYDADEELGIITGGYGTMSFPGKNYWVFSATDLNIQEQISTSYLYYDMKGCTAPPGSDLWIYLVIIGTLSAVLVIALVVVFIRKKSRK